MFSHVVMTDISCQFDRIWDALDHRPLDIPMKEYVLYVKWWGRPILIAGRTVILGFIKQKKLGKR